MGDQTPKVNSNITFSRETYERLKATARELNVTLSEIIDRALNEYIQTIPAKDALITPQILSKDESPVIVEEKIDTDEIGKLFTEGWTHERRLKLLKNGSSGSNNTNSTTARVESQPTQYYPRRIQ